MCYYLSCVLSIIFHINKLNYAPNTFSFQEKFHKMCSVKSKPKVIAMGLNIIYHMALLSFYSNFTVLCNYFFLF